MISSFDELVVAARKSGPKKIVVVGCEDADVLKAAADGRDMGLINGILVGRRDVIMRIAEENKLDVSRFEVQNVNDQGAVSYEGVRLTVDSGADMIMKGKVATADLLKAILAKEFNLVQGRILSHVGVIEVSGYGKLLLLTDGGMNIAPDLERKIHICRNAVEVAHALGCNPAYIAALTAVENVNVKMPATIDAAALAKMGDRGQFPGAVVDGPLALDNAISPAALLSKKIVSSVEGKADILLVPNIEAGNILYKSLLYFSKIRAAGIVVGGKIPVLVNSRADTMENRLMSMALGTFLAGK